MKKTLKIIIALLVIIVGIIIWYNLKLTSRSSNNQAVSFVVNPGEGIAGVADSLGKEKIISSPLVFKLYFYFNKGLPIQAGEYIFEKGSSMKAVIFQLESGVTAEKEFSVLIREGLNVKEINEYLKAKGYLKDDSFLTLATTAIKNLPKDLTNYSFMALLPPTATLEGYLFPDTYRLYKDFTASDLIQKMLTNFDKRITPDLRSAIISSKKTLPEIITMASILEKEVRTEADMKIVSGIFWDRIKIGQALQSCATLGYVLGVNKAQYSYEDTQIKSPYNTYKNPGLTPGPISNPGLKSIGAAINPTKTDYNYFLSRPDTGETVFSKTLEEHNAAKAKYLK